jgi:hypothetical protein
MDKLVEKVARALASVDGRDPDALCGVPSCPIHWMLFENDAIAAIEAMTSYKEEMDIVIDELVLVHGELYRRWIESAILFLDEQEPKWGLTRPIDKKAYIADLISKVIVNG